MLRWFFKSILMVITGSDILSCSVLPEITWWCLVFRGVGMLSVTLSASSSSREQDWDRFHRDRLPRCPVSPVSASASLGPVRPA